MYDVAILGGGPAGAAAAISLRQLCPSLSIVLLEATGYEQWRVGETLSPAGQDLLRGLGCWEHFRAEQFLESFGTRAAWGSERAHENEFLFSARGNGWHLDRKRFDAMLCRVAQQAGTQVFLETRFVDSAKLLNPEGWRLLVRCSGSRNNSNTGDLKEISTRFVIDATGRSAAFATRQGVKRQVADQLTGTFMMFQLPEATALCDTRTLVEAQQDGWWYSSLLPDSIAVVAWMSDTSLIRNQRLHRRERWLEHLSRSRLTLDRVTKAQPQASIRLWSAQSQCLDRFCGEDWVATGDAASTFDPLSSAGILKALRWGKIASFAAADYFSAKPFLERYDSLLRAEYKSYLATRQRFYQMEQRWPQSVFWSRRSEAGSSVA